MISATDHLPSGPVRKWRIPSTDSDAFAALPAEERADVLELLDLFNECEQSPNGIVEALRLRATESTKRGRSFGALRTKYYALKADGWRALVNKTKVRAAAGAGAQPEAFIQHWQGLIERNQRKAKPAFRELVRAWSAGEFIPGYGTWRDHWRKTHDTLPPTDPRFCPELPAGWSYENLMRYQPTKLEVTAARRGLGAARRFAPGVLTTRAGLRVGQFYQFDDVWHDLKVNVLGWAQRAVRPLELGCLDVHSASRFAWGIRPMLPKADGTDDRIKEAEMRMFVASVLIGTGYSADGCTLMVENGTAAIREDMERMLWDLSDGKIRVERSGINGKNQLLFDGRGKGNPNHKACLESLHNLMHNELANVAGQIGMNRDHAPEQIHGMDRRNELILRAMAALPAEFAAQMKQPFLTWSAFNELAARVYEQIDTRTDHELEGWVESGYITQEIRLDPSTPWIDARALSSMEPAKRDAVLAFASLPGNTRTAKLSPREVWRRGAPGLARLNLSALPVLLGELGARELTVGEDHTITFRDQTMGPGDFCFDTVLTDADLRTTRLRAGDKFLAYFSPFAPDMLTLCNARGGFVGSVKRITRVIRSDMEALHREMGRATAAFNELVAPVAARGAALMRKEIAAVQHNAAVILAATEHTRPAEHRAKGPLPAASAAAMLEPDFAQPAPAAAQVEPREGDDDELSRFENLFGD